MQITLSLKCSRSLGNCLFQYAYARRLADQLRASFYINKCDWHHGAAVSCQLGYPDNTDKDTMQLFGHFQDVQASIDYIKVNSFIEVEPRCHTESYMDNICYVHVRGGDFLSVSTFNLSKEYYNAAQRKMLKYAKKPLKFHVITDDIDHAKKVVKYAEQYSTGKVEHDFRMLSLARYAIISNSTFSWWATRLSGHLRFCIAPNSWRSEDDRLLATAPHINISL